MKDFEYNDVPGLEDINTQRQLDTFEAVSLWGSKDRFIFDFSTRFKCDSYKNRFWVNEAHWNWIWDSKNGVPGDASLYYKNFDWSVAASDLIPYSTEQTILGEDYDSAPYFNENGAIEIGSKYAGLYGQGSSATNPDYVSTIRSGYYEFTIKTDKNNCIIGYGGHSQKLTYPIAIDEKSIVLPDGAGDFTEFKILIENGKLKLEYNNPTGNNKTSFSIIGNKTISDNEWHHIVVNLGKPGVKRNYSKKHNERFIEFWIDGKLDIRNSEYLNDQIFFPAIGWLLIDPTLTLPHDDVPWLNIDYSNRGPYGGGDGVVKDVLGFATTSDIVIGNNELYYFNGINDGYFNDRGNSVAFRGSIHTYVAGFNQCLDMSEIQLRNKLWRGIEKSPVDNFVANAELISPIITGNKKRALKLFWNNLVNSKSKNGIELDNSYEIDTMSITHKIANSFSEIYNIDKSNIREINYLGDVRIAIKDNLFVIRPGAVWINNNSDIAENVGVLYQNNMYDPNGLNALTYPEYGSTLFDLTPKINSWLTKSSIENISISGVTLNNGDRVLLTNQYNSSENGIYIFNGFDSPLTRAEDANSSAKLNNAVVRVIDGYYKDTSWILLNSISTLNEKQTWKELESHPTSETIGSNPLFMSKWTTENGNIRLIDLEEDLDINKYDVIAFMNYPETNEEIKEHMVGLDDFEIKINYDNFIKSLQNVCAQGASLYVSSPKLATDLGVVKKFEYIEQEVEDADGHSAEISPFEVNEPGERYFDTHRQNLYHLTTEVPGLTDKETYILTDFINYIPDNNYDYEQYHAKYSYRQLGLQEGNEFFIPGFALRKITVNDKLPGFRANQKGINQLPVVNPSDIITGTTITKLSNTHYHDSEIANNEYDDYVTTIIVHDGQLLNGQPISGKIFINCVEDGYTFSREEYNKAIIQIIPENDPYETLSTRAWQYSTTRLDRVPNRINVKELTKFGQTTPTNGGGGALIQAPSNCSNGVIRSETDKDNIDYQSDLYPSINEEKYQTQEIPILSMTWLGLQWLAE